MKPRIAVSGASGFIGAHLRRRLERIGGLDVRPIERADWSNESSLARIVRDCDVVFHLAGVNRDKDDEVERTNVELAERLTQACGIAGASPRIVYASSTQESRDTPYGRAKRLAGERLLEWANWTGGEAIVLVIPNVFGPGCRPFYNSVVATFCHQLASDRTPTIDVDAEIEFVSVGDLVERMTTFVDSRPTGAGRIRIAGTERLRVSELLAKLEAIRDAFVPGGVTPDLTDPFDRDLYLTYLSHREPAGWTRRPEVRLDARGELYEVLKLARGGQIFFSTTRPGVVRGNHFHTHKTEWFCVVRGRAVIRLRHIDGGETVEFKVSGEAPTFVAIPAFHSHHIENVGDVDLLTLFWANEIFDPERADTFADASLTAARGSSSSPSSDAASTAARRVA